MPETDQELNAALVTVEALKQRVFQLELQIIDMMAAHIAAEGGSPNGALDETDQAGLEGV